MKQVTKDFIAKTLKFIVFWLVFAFIFYLLGRYIKLFLPLIGGFIVFGLMNPLIKILLQHTGIKRKWAVLISLILVIVLLGGVITWFAVLATREVQDIYLKWPAYAQSITQNFQAVWQKAERVYLGLDPQVTQTLRQSTGKISDVAYNFMSKAVVALYSIVFLLPDMFLTFVIALVAAYFIARNWEAYKRGLLHLFPSEWRDSLREISNDFSLALVGFLRTELILVIVSTIIVIIALYLFGVKYALLLGFLAGLFSFLPVMGSGLVLVPWGVVEMFMGNVSLGVKLCLLVVVLSVMRHIVEPKLLGDNVGLDPLLVIMSMFIGLEVIGPLGLIFGPFVVIFYQSLKKAGVFQNL